MPNNETPSSASNSTAVTGVWTEERQRAIREAIDGAMASEYDPPALTGRGHRLLLAKLERLFIPVADAPPAPAVATRTETQQDVFEEAYRELSALHGCQADTGDGMETLDESELLARLRPFLKRAQPPVEASAPAITKCDECCRPSHDGPCPSDSCCCWEGKTIEKSSQCECDCHSEPDVDASAQPSAPRPVEPPAPEFAPPPVGSRWHNKPGEWDCEVVAQYDGGWSEIRWTHGDRTGTCGIKISGPNWTRLPDAPPPAVAPAPPIMCWHLDGKVATTASRDNAYPICEDHTYKHPPRSPPFTWGDEQRAGLVPGATVEFINKSDQRLRREVVSMSEREAFGPTGAPGMHWIVDMKSEPDSNGDLPIIRGLAIRLNRCDPASIYPPAAASRERPTTEAKDGMIGSRLQRNGVIVQIIGPPTSVGDRTSYPTVTEVPDPYGRQYASIVI